MRNTERVLILIDEDGTATPINPESMSSLLALLSHGTIKTIVAGEVGPNGVIWEKQFNAVTVMPREFAPTPRASLDTVQSVAGGIALLMLNETVESGGTVEIPSFGIAIGKENNCD